MPIDAHSELGSSYQNIESKSIMNPIEKKPLKANFTSRNRISIPSIDDRKTQATNSDADFRLPLISEAYQSVARGAKADTKDLLILESQLKQQMTRMTEERQMRGLSID